MAGPVRRASGGGLRRLGGAWHRFGVDGVAESFYRAATRLDPGDVTAVRRYAESREAHGDLDAAVDVYSRAIADGGLDDGPLADCLRRRAALLGDLGRWDEAAADYRACLAADPARVAVMRLLVEALERAGDVHAAIAVARRSRAHFPGALEISRWLARAHADVGDWDTSIDLWRRLADARPSDVSLRCALAASAADAASSPFAWTDDGFRWTTPDERDAWRDVAIGALERVTADSPSRVRDVYRLGRLHEDADRLADAAGCYARAVEGLGQIDASWTHRSRSAWRFRLDRVRVRMGEATVDGDSRPSRRVRDETRRGDGGPFTPPGSFRAEVTDLGLAIEGVVLPGADAEVVVAVDGAPLMTLPVDAMRPLRGFGWTVRHRALDDFAPTTGLTVTCGGAALVNRRGGADTTVEVPGGSGAIASLLEDGRTFDKKGCPAPPPDLARDLAAERLAAYATAREVARRRLGRDLFLMYGTLLGVWRDGAPIPGDDDFDVGFRCRAVDPARMRAEVMDAMVEFVDAGFDVRVAIDGRPFLLVANGVGIDVNPVWFYKGRSWSFTAHRFRPDDLEPVRRASVDGVAVALPRRPDVVLRDSYGPDWRTPRSAFRYFRSSEDLRVLRRMRLTESEVESVRRRAADAADRTADAGRFTGYDEPECGGASDDPGPP